MLQEYTTPALETRFSPNEHIKERIDLQYIGGGSDKVYILIVTQNNVANNFGVTGFYGRRGARLTTDDKGAFATQTDASRKAVSIMNEKIKKGYTKVGSQSFSSGGTMAQNIQSKQMHVSDLTPTVGSYNPGPISAESSAKKIENLLKNDNIILEPFFMRGNTPYYYVRMYWNANIQDKGWYVYRTDGTLAFTESEVPENIDVAWDQRDNIYLAYRTEQDRLAFFDIYHLGDADRAVHNLPWKSRRAMLTQAFWNLFPSRKDLYDTSFFAHLNDYAYDNKAQWVEKRTPGEMIVARDINGTHKKSSVVFNVV